jgi:hypothetical protein
VLDPDLEENGVFQIKYPIPYSDLDLSEEERKRYTDANEPLAFGHSLEDQIGGQIKAGFAITGFYEDRWTPDINPLSKLMDLYCATKAEKT